MPLVSHNVELSAVSFNDAEAIALLLQDKEISETTLKIPYPYTIHDARDWLERTFAAEAESKVRINYAIRDSSGAYMGLIGIQWLNDIPEDTCGFGYWLGKRFWNKGIITEAIRKFCVLLKVEYHIKTLEADIFSFN